MPAAPMAFHAGYPAGRASTAWQRSQREARRPRSTGAVMRAHCRGCRVSVATLCTGNRPRTGPTEGFVCHGRSQLPVWDGRKRPADYGPRDSTATRLRLRGNDERCERGNCRAQRQQVQKQPSQSTVSREMAARATTAITLRVRLCSLLHVSNLLSKEDKWCHTTNVSRRQQRDNRMLHGLAW